MDAKQPLPPPQGYPHPPSAKRGEPRGETWVMGTPMMPQAHPSNQKVATWVPVDYSTSSFAGDYNPRYANYSASAPGGSNNPYVHVSPVSGSSDQRTKETICKVLDRCGKKLEDSTRKAGDLASNVWHHLKTSPSITDAAMARLAQGTKVFAEGGNEKVFQQNFGIYTGEQLQKAFACYLSTSTGPVIGTLYLSSQRLAFCSDKALCNYTASGQQEWIYYKVAAQLNQLKGVNPSSSNKNPAEKYIQIVTSDNHEFWFMGFVSYDSAVKNLKMALQGADMKQNHQKY